MPKYTSALLAACVGAAAMLPAQQLEDLGPHYRKLRGINYLATYWNLVGTTFTVSVTGPSSTTEQQPCYYAGVNSSTAMWLHYDTSPGGSADEVSAQLSWLKTAGINTVRVFLSYPIWKHYEDFPNENVIPGVNDSVRKFEDFLQRCEANGIWCTPVLWDGTGALGASPPGEHVTDNLAQWHLNPGFENQSSWLSAGPTMSGTDGANYLTDFVNAANTSSAFLFWHLMNEAKPEGTQTLQQVADFIKATIDVIEAIDSSHKKLLLSLHGNDPISLLVSDPGVDLLGVHPYGATRASIESMVHDATNIATGGVVKPVIATEIGSPGLGLASYKDAVRFALGVPRPDLGQNETGIGYMPWVSNIGWSGYNYPFKDSNGLFYGDGQIRDVGEVMAFVEAAIRQGVPAASLFTQAQLTNMVKVPGNVGYVAQTYVGSGQDDYDEMLVALAQPVPSLNSAAEMLESWAYLSSLNLALLPPANGSLGNPYASPCSGTDYYRCMPTGQDLIDMADLLGIASLEGPSWVTFYNNLLAAVGRGDFNDPVVLQHVHTNVNVPWVNLIRPYLEGQRGPYSLANTDVFGSGCPGTNGVPTLSYVAPDDQALMGRTLTMEITNLPAPSSSLPTAMMGFGLPVAADLGPIGMPGCTLYIETVSTNTPLGYATASTSVSWQIAIPSSYGLIGVEMVMQALVPDDNVGTPTPSTMTNALVATIGI